MRTLARVAWAALRRRPGHTAIVATAVALATGLVTAIAAVNVSALASLRATFAFLGGDAQLTVRGRAGDLDEDLLAMLRRQPGVDHVTALVSGTLWITDAPMQGETLTLVGVDVTDDRVRDTYRAADTSQPIDGRMLQLELPDSVLLTDQFMARHQLAVGDRLRVLTPTGAKTLTIRGGLVTTGVGTAFGGNLAVMDILAAQGVLARPGVVDQFDLVLDDARDAEAVKVDLEAKLPTSMEVVTPERRGAATERVLRSFQAILQGISLLGLLLGAFVSYNVSATAVVMRLGELETLRCVGAGRSWIRSLVMVEAALPAVAGTAAGIPIGALFARGLCRPLTQALEFVARAPLSQADPEVPYAHLPLILAAGIGAALVGALAPAISASEVARREVARSRRPASTRIVGGAAVLAAALAGACLWAAIERQSAGLANAAILLLNLAAVSFAFVALPTLAPMVQQPLRFFGGYGRIAGDALIRAPVRTSVTVTVVMLAISVPLCIDCVVASFRGSVLDYVGRLWAADLILSSAFRSEGWVFAPMTADLVDEIGGMPGVARVAAVRFRDVGDGKEQMTIGAFDRAFFDERGLGAWAFVAGDPATALPAVAAGKAVLLSETLARRQRLRVGQSYRLDPPSGPLTLPIAGIVVDYQSQAGLVVLRRETYAERWRDRLVNTIALLAEPGTPTSELQRSLVDRFGERLPLRVLTPAELRENTNERLENIFGFLWALRAVVIAVAALGVADTLLGLGVARARELGVLRAIGARRRGIYALFELEMLACAGIGIALGLVACLALATAWIRFLDYQMGWRMDLRLPLRDAFILAVCTLAVCGAATLLPVAWLGRRQPARLLSQEPSTHA